MSMLRVSNAVQRAVIKKANHTSLVEPAKVNISCDLMIFIGEHIHLLEEQLGQYQNLTQEWKVEAGRMLKINAQLCNILEDKGFSKEEIQKIVDYV